MPTPQPLVDRACSQNNAIAPSPLQTAKRSNTIASNQYRPTAPPDSPTQTMLPTRRSLQMLRPHATDANQASRNAYVARRAAKSVLQRRRTEQAPTPSVGQTEDTSPVHPDAEQTERDPLAQAVINVTVDAAGVRVSESPRTLSVKSVKANKQSTMDRTTSRKNLVRTSSRTSMRSGRDFRARVQDEKENSGSTGNHMEAYFAARRQSMRDWKQPVDDEWDGSMPRRHSSRSFIDRAVKEPLGAPVPEDAGPVLRENQANGPRATCVTEGVVQAEEAKQGVEAVEAGKEMGKEVSGETVQAVEKEVREEDGKPVECVDETKLPDCGQWCEKCGGVGLLITALLSERQKERLEDGGSEQSPKKNGWRAVVLGDNGRSKLVSENGRLAKENKTLFDIVHQLQRRFTDLRKTVA